MFKTPTPKQAQQIALDVTEWHQQDRIAKVAMQAENEEALKEAADIMSALFDKWRYETDIFNILTVRCVNEFAGAIDQRQKLKQ